MASPASKITTHVPFDDTMLRAVPRIEKIELEQKLNREGKAA